MFNLNHMLRQSDLATLVHLAGLGKAWSPLFGPRSYVAPHADDCSYKARTAFTLIELLVVIAIIGILSGLTVAALRGAQLDTLYAKTRGTIRKIDAIITDRYDAYRNQGLDYLVHYDSKGAAKPGTAKQLARMPKNGQPNVSFNTNDTTIETTPPGGKSDSILQARLQNTLLREVMRMEMPDCPGDVKLLLATGATDPASHDIETGYLYYDGSNNVPVFARLQSPAKLIQIRSAIANRSAAYQKKLTDAGGTANEYSWANANVNAELLYLVVESSYVNGTYGVESFVTSELGDTDGDGFREFIDAWGNPIQWLRWPAGYFDDAEYSQTQNLQGNASRAIVTRYEPDPFIGQVVSTGDDFDPANADRGYFTGNVADVPPTSLRPLIVSPGPDAVTGLRMFFSGKNAQKSNTHLFSLSDVVWKVGPEVSYPDPYHPRSLNANMTIQANYNQCLGGVLNVEVDGNGSAPFSVPIGINKTGFEFGGELDDTVANMNTQVRQFVSDNVTNFDEVGGAL